MELVTGCQPLGGMHHIPLQLTSETAGGLHITLRRLEQFIECSISRGANMHTDATTIDPKSTLANNGNQLLFLLTPLPQLHGLM